MLSKILNHLWPRATVMAFRGGRGGNAIQCTTVLGAIEGFDGAMVTVVINSYGP